MDLRYLGPLEVVEGDRPIPLGGPKQRLVLAHLLVRANQVVPTRLLIDEVWGDSPPLAVRNSLQSYISNLRRALGPERIESHGQGYLLRVAPDEVDAVRFEALLDEGRRTNRADPEAGGRTLRAALGLWRGPPFAQDELDGSLATEADRLEERRLVALEERIRADLASGSAAPIVGELEALTAAHPLREGLWGQLMLALYRSERQAEALATFERLRGHLVDELGIDPSSELQRLHARILRQDPTLERGVAALRGYRLLEQLGQGPLGVVWRATAAGTDREVAVKAFHPQVANSSMFVRDFESAAEAVARLEHPHILPVYDHWREPGSAYLAMRFVPGGSLRAAIDRSAPLTTESVLAIIRQVGRALSAAARRGIVHGDVKPSNVLLDDDGNAYLADFGLAPATHGSHEPPTPATDAHDLGRLLAALITDPPAPLSEVIDRATAQDRDRRFGDADALLAALEGAGPSEPAPPAGVPGPSTGNPTVEDAAAIPNPYKGLRAFTEADAPEFFGRDVLVAQLTDRLCDPDPASRFLAVVGPSGSGKSSVVRAGLIPRLRGGALASGPCFVVHMTPGGYPFEELEAALLRAATDAPPSLIEQLERDHHGLLRAVKRILPDDGSELVLVIDQFEELFTLVEDDARRKLFIQGLLTALHDPRTRLRIVITLRADFYGEPLRYQGLADLLRARTEVVVPLTAEQIERAVAGPAERVGVAVHPALVARIVGDVTDQPGALPLLQYALTELFDQRNGQTLELRDYHQIGGVSGALARRADATYTNLTAQGAEATRQLFLRLVILGDGLGDARRRVLRSELLSIEGTATDAMNATIDLFGDARLLAFDRDSATREPTVEVAHEALMGAWDRLRDWIDDAREEVRVERRLAAATREWIDSGHDDSFLVTGLRLEQFESWREHADLALTADEQRFLQASLTERDRSRERADAQRAHETALERRAFRRMRALVGVLAAAALVAAGLTVFALDRSQQARAQGAQAEVTARIATSRELAAASVADLDVDPERSILLALEAVAVTRSEDDRVLPEAEEALHRAVTAARIVRSFPDVGGALAWSPDGATFVTEGPEDTGVIDVRDAATGQSLLAWHGHDVDVNDVAFSGDGTVLASAGDDGAVRAWDPATGEELGSIQGEPDGEVWGSSLSHDGSLLAATGPDSVVRVLDLTRGEVVLEFDALEDPNATSFSPDGRMLVVSADGPPHAVVLDLASGQQLFSLDGHEYAVFRASWSPDGRWLATASMDSTVRLWDGRTGEPRFALHGHTGPVMDADWSPDGSRLVTGSLDGSAKVWEIGPVSTREVLTLTGHGTRSGIVGVAFSRDGSHVMLGPMDISAVQVWDVSLAGDAQWWNLPAATHYSRASFTPDGEELVNTSGDGSVTVWSMKTGAEVLTTAPGPGPVTNIEVSPDGSLIAGGGENGVGVWEATTGRKVTQISGGDGWQAGNHLAWSPDGAQLAVSSTTGAVVILDHRENRILTTLREGRTEVFGLAFSPDGQRLAVSGRLSDRPDPLVGNHLRLWDWQAGELVQQWKTVSLGLAFDPSGTWIVTGDDLGLPAIWDAGDGKLLRALHGHEGPVHGVDVSPDGTTVATAGLDATVRLWDRESGLQKLILRGHGSAVYGVEFSPDGSRLASTSVDGTTRVWAIDLDDLHDLARGKLTRALTDDECRQYLHQNGCANRPA